MTNTKRFDRELYDKYDGTAKAAALQFFVQQGFTEDVPLDKQEELYKKGDLVLSNPEGAPRMIEVEVKLLWKKTGEWEGYSDITVPYRKHKSISDYYVMFNASLDTLAMTKMSNILESDTLFKSTRYTRNERFFATPLDKFKFYTLIDGVWKLF